MAWQTLVKRSNRSVVASLFSSQYLVMGIPRTSSMQKYGRPESVLLAVLVDRSGRQLPIQADACGGRLELEPGTRIKLTGPDPMRLVVQEGSHG